MPQYDSGVAHDNANTACIATGSAVYYRDRRTVLYTFVKCTVNALFSVVYNCTSSKGRDLQ
jgi:hypothetical protein